MRTIVCEKNEIRNEQQATVELSSTEAEYIGSSIETQEAIWLWASLSDLKSINNDQRLSIKIIKRQ